MGWEEVTKTEGRRSIAYGRPNVSGINECRKLVQKRRKINTGEELYR
jgi:hypothetical protein